MNGKSEEFETSFCFLHLIFRISSHPGSSSMVYWRHRKRDEATQELLAVVRRLSDDRFISSPFTSEVRLEVMGNLEKVRSDLLEQGYTVRSLHFEGK